MAGYVGKGAGGSLAIFSARVSGFEREGMR
jgi:hypothetical protein